MSHVRVERFRSGDREHDAAEHRRGLGRVIPQEVKPVHGIKRAENLHGVGQVKGAQHAEGRKPDQHDRPEEASDHIRAFALNEKQAGENHHGRGHDKFVKPRTEGHKTLGRAEHGNRRCDHAVSK